MREIRSYGSVGERGGNEPLYPETGELNSEPLAFYPGSVIHMLLFKFLQ